MSDMTTKQVVAEAHASGEYTKAALAREFGVSARTIGRWIDEVKSQQPPNDSLRAVNDFSDLSVGDTVVFCGVPEDSDAFPFNASKVRPYFFDGITAKVNEVSKHGIGITFFEGEAGEVDQVLFSAKGLWDWTMFKLVDKPEVVAEGSLVIDESPKTLSVVMTGDYLSIGCDGRADTITSDHPKFKEFYQRIVDSAMSQDVLHDVLSQMSIKNMIESFEYHNVTVDGVSEQVLYKGTPVHGVVVERIISSLRDGGDGIERLVKFLDKLMENPSYRAVNELYSFLEATDIQIDGQGNVLCFKKVRDDYKDIYSGTFDNSKGSTPSIERNMVDEDMNRTCSHGLHVCSKSYLPHFGGSTGYRVMLVRVNPADFVAIPVDYNFAKARVCKYEVIEDVTETYRDM